MKPAEIARARMSRIRTKINVDVELVMLDGTCLEGSVFISLNERVQDLLNGDKPFLPLRLANQEILLIAKQAIAVCKPLDEPG